MLGPVESVPSYVRPRRWLSVAGSLLGIQVGSALGRYGEAPEPVLPGLGEGGRAVHHQEFNCFLPGVISWCSEGGCQAFPVRQAG